MRLFDVHRVITMIAMIVCIGNFLYIHFNGGNPMDNAIHAGAYYKQRIRTKKEYWRLLTGGFIHISPWHLLMNLYALYVMGSMELLLGHFWYALILLGSIFCGNLALYLKSDTPMAVGLSGGLYGIMFAEFALMIYLHAFSLSSFLPLLVVNVAMNFMPGVAWQAHLAGGAAGFVLMVLRLVLARL